VKNTFFLIIIVAILTCPLGVLSSDGFSVDHDYSKIKCVRVVNGEVLILETGERVRLIGLDVPESFPNTKVYRDARIKGQPPAKIIEQGKVAVKYINGLIANEYVRLEFDVKREDKYGRLLAYVYLADGTFINAHIVEQGYSNITTLPPNLAHVELFKDLYKQARKKKFGIWAIQ